MSDRTDPKPTRSGEAPDDPGRTAQDAPRDQAAKPSDPADSLPTRRDRTGIDHPVADDPSPDLTGSGDT
ncbi:hypothetical protein [Paracraurococcus lichenis]|uniref:Uncharacterized protein n=1 Tax=Paracraurococcus lichenis TaxID=3064888 RepID=A0ABT9DUL2_9PROT|nr:hypothetical protein [Paracraurococcus sp. LOR1-02]MDO9707590.1 hypothetical protein [Paracraurococcus sp. LOR1-02]